MSITPIKALINNLKFLGFNAEDHGYGNPLTIDDNLFASSQDNTLAFQCISYFLFTLIYAARALNAFQSVWPVQTIQQSQAFVTISLRLLYELKNEYFENVSLEENILIDCQGESIIKVLLALSKIALDKIAVELEQIEIKSSSQLQLEPIGEENQKLSNESVQARKDQRIQEAPFDHVEPKRQEMKDKKSTPQKNEVTRAKGALGELKKVGNSLVKVERVRTKAAIDDKKIKAHDGSMKGLRKTLTKKKEKQIMNNSNTKQEVNKEKDNHSVQQKPIPKFKKEATLPAQHKNKESLQKNKRSTATRPESDDRIEMKRLKREADERLKREVDERLKREADEGLKREADEGLKREADERLNANYTQVEHLQKEQTDLKEKMLTKQDGLRLEQTILLERARIKRLHEESFEEGCLLRAQLAASSEHKEEIKVIEKELKKDDIELKEDLPNSTKEDEQQQQSFANSSYTIKEEDYSKEKIVISHPSEFLGKMKEILSRTYEDVEEFDPFANIQY